MSDLFAWLLDLDSLQFGAEGVRLGFERTPPVWAWPGVIGFAALLAVWSYSRLVGARPARALLATARALTLCLLAVLIAGPQLVESEESIEQDWVLVLVDRSESMTIRDADLTTTNPRTRDEALADAIEKSWPAWRELAANREVVWLGFDAGAYELARERSAGAFDAHDLLGEPSGRRTAIGRALDQALRRAAARPLAGVVVLSDGRSIDAPTRSAVRRLQAERVPVHVVPFGSREPAGDLAIRRVEGPDLAFVEDLTPVTVEIERLGAGEQGGVVQLIDARTEQVLDERRIEPGAQDRIELALAHRAEFAGEATWVVRLKPDGVDLIQGNNEATLAIELVDRPLRTLYVDGYPRWGQRYLRNLLLREESVVSANLLLAPDRRSSQEGDIEIADLPDSPEGWAEFDAIILGDVRPEVFTPQQLEDLREHVAVRGGGLLWIGGEGATPSSWWGTPLADLLPFSRDALGVMPPGARATLRPSPLSERLGVLRLGETAQDPWPVELSDFATGWSALRWWQPIRPAELKPTAEPLAIAIDELGDSHAVVTSMRYGAGRVIYVATDEIWRWRYGRGEALFERFWLQLIRLLGRESLARSGEVATLSLSPRRPLVGQTVRIAVELLDQSFVELGLAEVAVRLERDPGPGRPESARTIDLSLRAESDRRTFSGLWAPDQPGEWSIRVVESALSGFDLVGQAVVSFPDDELRRPETDHVMLASLAEETGGAIIPPSRLSDVAEQLPNRQLRIVNERGEPLWDTPLALILLVLCLSLEWVGRRLIRLI